MIVKVSVPNRFQFKAVPSFTAMLWQKKGEVHYIGGADILPPPLESKKEAEMISLLGTEGEKEARSLLIEHNLRLVVYIAKKFDNTAVGVEDLISIGTIGLIKAINTFNPEKNIKLATYASRCIENEILMYLRRSSKTKAEVSIDEPLNVDWDGNELEELDRKRRMLLLRRKISECGCVVLFAEMYGNYKEWIDLAIDIANEMHKPLIGVRDWDASPVPKRMQINCRVTVKCERNAIVAAIQEYCL